MLLSSSLPQVHIALQCTYIHCVHCCCRAAHLGLGVQASWSWQPSHTKDPHCLLTLTLTLADLCTARPRPSPSPSPLTCSVRDFDTKLQNYLIYEADAQGDLTRPHPLTLVHHSTSFSHSRPPFYLILSLSSTILPHSLTLVHHSTSFSPSS